MKEGAINLVGVMISVLMLTNVFVMTPVYIPDDGSPEDAIALAAKTVWVDDDFVDDPPNHRWNTIQEGVDDAQRGDTVYVYNGTYHERVSVKKTIFLEGESRSSTIIDGGGQGSVLTIGPGINSVHVTEFTITSSGTGWSGIRITTSKKNTIENNIISSNDRGISIGVVGYNFILNNTISNNNLGIHIGGVNNYNLISGNNILNNRQGIRVLADYNTFSGNTFSSDGYGWAFDITGDASHNTISGNTISNYGAAIVLGYNYLQHPNDNTISDNSIYDVFYGIHISRSSGDIIVNNSMVGAGITLYGNMLEYWNTHVIDASNTVNGKPVYYWKNTTGGRIPSGSGQIILANCTNVEIENQNVTDGNIGILVSFSSGITIANNSVSSNMDEGILLYSSNNNTIDGNALSSNGAYGGPPGGVVLWLSDNNTVTNNLALGNWHGIFLRSSNGSVVANNSVSENNYGITLVGSSDDAIINNNVSGNTQDGFYFRSSNNNSIAYNNISSNNNYGVRFINGNADNLAYHNNFINNVNQVSDSDPEDNDWHHPTLLEGNYWSDYTGLDDGSGTGKHAIAGDLIGDTLIPHPGKDYDFYPCTVPNCWIAPVDYPPIANANGPYYGYEGSPITLDGSGSYDPDGDVLRYRWDLDNDTSWDTDWLSSPFFNQTWGDDYKGTLALQVATPGYEVADVFAEGNFKWFSDLNWINKRAQSFAPNCTTLSKIAVDVSVSFGKPDAHLYLYVRESLEGPNLSFAHLSPGELPNSRYVDPVDWAEFDIEDITVDPGKTYFFILTSPMQGGGNYEVHFGDDFYPDGISYYRHVTNDSWIERPGMDLRFRTYGSEMMMSEPAFTAVTVSNVAPTVVLKTLPIEAEVSLRIAGEKWHDVSVELYENEVLIASGSITRFPGSPNDQMLDLTHLQVDISSKYSATVRYTPENDPINGQPKGATPCWIILTFDDGEGIRLHHSFNVNHPDTYVWEVDLNGALLSRGLTFEATAYDPGADDLTFTWDFGDGTMVTSFYPNVDNNYPVRIVETVTHVFLAAGTFTVALTVEDDDGGATVAILKIIIP